MNHQSMVEVIRKLVCDYPDKGMGFIKKDGQINFRTYREIFNQSLNILAGLKKEGIAPGDIVLISAAKNEEILPVLWACLLGAIVPSILQAPLSFTSENLPFKKLVNVWELLNRPVVIASNSEPDLLQALNSGQLRLLDFNQINMHVGDDSLITNPKPEDLAYIQFSSGSTGNPKGIRLTHSNILHNIHDITHSNSLNPDSISVNWMPLYHDMGLIGFHFTLLYAQSWQYFIDIIDFIKNPLLWLNALSDLKADTTGSPNFGQALILRYLDRHHNHTWDFSNMKNFFNGAEPISSDIMGRFLKAMGEFGFPETAMIPCYGMAEATLAISMRDNIRPPVVRSFDRFSLYHKHEAVDRAGDSDSITLVGVGQALGHNEVRIMDDDDNELENQWVGNIQISGKNVSDGYPGTLRGDEYTPDGWLRTGDMGFFHQGELFITGRTKDLIFVHGQNYYAHDLEQSIVRLKKELYGKIACCAVFDSSLGRDKLIVFVVGPANEKFAENYREIRSIFNTNIGLMPDEIIPVKSSELPRTSSGKLQRYKMAIGYEKGEFSDYAKF
jgi:acyl-CoA synthetase (AMP-forming)/AMP-acid ligase II